MIKKKEDSNELGMSSRSTLPKSVDAFKVGWGYKTGPISGAFWDFNVYDIWTFKNTISDEWLLFYFELL